MELTGEHKIPAGRKAVWDALHDPEILKECIKGCQKLEMTDPHTLAATVQAKVGPVKAVFDADVTIVDPVEPERYTLVGEGKGGVAGFAKGSADVVLAEEGSETILTYTAKASVGGKLAQLGSRLVDTTAKKYAADFFEAFSEKLGGAPVSPPVRAAETRATGVADETGRMEPSTATIEEGLAEAEMAASTPAIDSPHGEDALERKLETAAGKGRFGGAFVWGILAFAVVILVLVALQ